MRQLFAAVPFVLGRALAAPAAAQDAAPEPKMNMVIIYGDD